MPSSSAGRKRAFFSAAHWPWACLSVMPITSSRAKMPGGVVFGQRDAHSVRFGSRSSLTAAVCAEVILLVSALGAPARRYPARSQRSRHSQPPLPPAPDAAAGRRPLHWSPSAARPVEVKGRYCLTPPGRLLEREFRGCIPMSQNPLFCLGRPTLYGGRPARGGAVRSVRLITFGPFSL